MLADGVADSQADYQLFETAYNGTGDWRVLSTCHRPHIGCQIWLSQVYHSYLEKWLVLLA